MWLRKINQVRFRAQSGQFTIPTACQILNILEVSSAFVILLRRKSRGKFGPSVVAPPQGSYGYSRSGSARASCTLHSSSPRSVRDGYYIPT